MLEEVGLFGGADGPSAAAHAAYQAKPKHGRLIGAIVKFAESLDEDDGIGKFAADRGLEHEPAAAFHSRYLTLPFPGTATGVATGELPGGRQGSIAWLEYSSDVDMEKEYVAVVTELAKELPTAWVDEADSSVAGFGAELPAAVMAIVRPPGWGISTSGNSACVYFRTSGTTSGADVDVFAQGANLVFNLLEG